MKKTLLLIALLVMAVISTGCVNKLAVKELNEKAQEFMEKGDYQQAIERLKSSIDLDPTVFETRYNLAIAYTKADDYPNAIAAYDEAIKMKPDFADSYYSLAVCQENLAKDIKSGLFDIDEDGKLTKRSLESDDDENVSDKLEGKYKEVTLEYLNAAITNYKTYLQKNPVPPEKSEVEAKIEDLQKWVDDLNS